MKHRRKLFCPHQGEFLSKFLLEWLTFTMSIEYIKHECIAQFGTSFFFRIERDMKKWTNRENLLILDVMRTSTTFNRY